MRRVLVCVAGVLLVAGGQNFSLARSSNRTAEVSLYGPAFQVGGLKFTIPSRWTSEPLTSPARAGQWHIPPPRGQAGGDADVTVFYFGPGVGGSATENISAWGRTMLDVDGKPAPSDIKHHETEGLKITQVTFFGTYNQPVPLPGVPPQARPNYGFFGAVIESPQGNIYWCATGPDTLITANLPLLNKVIDSFKPQN